MNDVAGIQKAAKLLAPAFVERAGAILLASDPDCAKRNRHAFETLSDLEAGCNHLHVLDYFENGAELESPVQDEDGYDLLYDLAHPDFAAACAIGVAILPAWASRLKAQWPEYEFRVYYTELDNPIVRFHRIRQDETLWLSDDEIRSHSRVGRAVVVDTTDWRIVDSKKG